MEKIRVPIIPVEKEDQVAKQILKSSAKEPDESNKFAFDGCNSSEDIGLLLCAIGMEKYIDLFLKSNVTLEVFLELDESDLKELGISDTNDLKAIMENLQIYGARSKMWSVPDDILQDLQIAKNVRNELVLLQNYCSYLELQMRKHRLTDYRINWKESALTYLKAFVDTSLLQAKILSQRVFHNAGDNHLIGKTVKLYNINLPKHLEEKLTPKKPLEGKPLIVSAAVLFGILSLGFYYIKNYFKNESY